MKTLFAIFLLVSASSFAQTIPMPIECYDTKETFKQLKEDFREAPAWSGKAKLGEHVGQTVLWFNNQTKTWTIGLVGPLKTCIVLSGTESETSSTPQIPQEKL